MLIDRLDKRLAAVEQALAAVMLGAIFVVITIGVVARYVVNMSIPWVEEVSRFLFIWIGYLASCYAFSQSRHMVLEVVYETLPPRLQQGIDIAFSLILQLVFLAMIPVALSAADRYVPSNYLRVPEGLVYLIIPLSFLLFSFHNLVILVGQLRALKPSSGSDGRSNGPPEQEHRRQDGMT